MRGCASKDVGPQRGWIWEVPRRLEKEMSANEDAGPEGEWTMRSHISWEENETPFIRVWNLSLAVLKTLRGSPKGKAQRGQYLLEVGGLGLIHIC